MSDNYGEVVADQAIGFGLGVGKAGDQILASRQRGDIAARRGMTGKQDPLDKPASPFEQYMGNRITQIMEENPTISPQEAGQRAAWEVQAGLHPGADGSPQQPQGASGPPAPTQGMAPAPNVAPAPRGDSEMAPQGGGMTAPAPQMPTEAPRQPLQSAPQGAPAPQGGGMTGQGAPPVQTHRDFMAATRGGAVVNSFRPKYRPTDQQIAIDKNRAEGNNTIAQTKGDAGIGREALKGGFAQARVDSRNDVQKTELKEKSRQFDLTLKYKYDALHGAMDRIKVQVDARREALRAGKQDKDWAKMVEVDAKAIAAYEREIGDLYKARTAASVNGTIDPKTIEDSDKKIHALQNELDDLKRSNDLEIHLHGGRKGLSAPPGTERPAPGGIGPEDRPNQLPPRDPMLVPDRQGATVGTPQQLPDTRSPKMINLKDKKTGQVKPVPADLIEQVQKEHPNDFNQMYEIQGINDAFGP